MGVVPPRPTLTDRILAKTVLRFFPSWVKPNHLTILRFFVIPIVLLLLWRREYVYAGVLFFMAALTDALDGALARTRNQVTTWGKLYDPLADKLLIGTVVYVLVLNYVDRFAAWLIIILEAIIVVAALVMKDKQREVQANVWGKIKMNLQVLGVLILFLSIVFNLEQLLPVSRGTFYLAIAFAVLSLFTYGI